MRTIDRSTKCRGWEFVLLSASAVAVFWMAIGCIAPLDASPRVGDRFGNWVFNCKAYGPGDTKCGLTQDVRIKNGGKRLFSASIAYVGPSNTLTLVMNTPLNSLLLSGVQITVDSEASVTLPFQQCRKEGCIALQKISPALRRQLAIGRKMKVSFKLILNKGLVQIPATISLDGTAKGIMVLEGGIPEGRAADDDESQFPVF